MEYRVDTARIENTTNFQVKPGPIVTSLAWALVFVYVSLLCYIWYQKCAEGCQNTVSTLLYIPLSLVKMVNEKYAVNLSQSEMLRLNCSVLFLDACHINNNVAVNVDIHTCIYIFFAGRAFTFTMHMFDCTYVPLFSIQYAI